MKNIIWNQPDGKVAVTTILDGSDTAEHAALIQGRGDIPADWQAVVFDYDGSWPTVEQELWRWNGSSIVTDLDLLKGRVLAQINAARATANTSTFEHGGKTFSCDQLSRGDIDGVNGEVALTGALPQGFPGAWKAVDNTFLPITDVAAWTAFYRAMVAQGAVNFAHAQQLKAQLASATTPEAVAAIVW